MFARVLPIIVSVIASVSGAICIAAVFWLTAKNSSAKGLAFATSALFAAMLGTALNAYYELQSPPDEERLLFSDYTVDRLRGIVAQNKYSLEVDRRALFELSFGKVDGRVSSNPQNSMEDTIRDLITVSFLQFIVTDFPGWGGTIESGNIFGQSKSTSSTRSPNCQEYDIGRINDALKKNGNEFASSKLGEAGMAACVPPQTLVTVERNCVYISSPYGSVVFVAGAFRAGQQTNPEDNSDDPLLPDARTPRFFRFAHTISIKRHVNWGYSKNAHINDYISWQNSIMEGATKWFASFPLDATPATPFISPFRKDGVSIVTNDGRRVP